jgi:hypothetical protein
LMAGAEFLIPGEFLRRSHSRIAAVWLLIVCGFCALVGAGMAITGPLPLRAVGAILLFFWGPFSIGMWRSFRAAVVLHKCEQSSERQPVRKFEAPPQSPGRKRWKLSPVELVATVGIVAVVLYCIVTGAPANHAAVSEKSADQWTEVRASVASKFSKGCLEHMQGIDSLPEGARNFYCDCVGSTFAANLDVRKLETLQDPNQEEKFSAEVFRQFGALKEGIDKICVTKFRDTGQ